MYDVLYAEEDFAVAKVLYCSLTSVHELLACMLLFKVFTDTHVYNNTCACARVIMYTEIPTHWLLNCCLFFVMFSIQFIQ